jgi:hypothetical protein
MDTFAETAIIGYRLSIGDQRKKNFRFPFAANKRKFAISLFYL